MPQYKNQSGLALYLVEIGTGAVHRVGSGETVEIVDPASVKGLVGQEAVWEPVRKAPPKKKEEE